MHRFLHFVMVSLLLSSGSGKAVFSHVAKQELCIKSSLMYHEGVLIDLGTRNCSCGQSSGEAALLSQPCSLSRAPFLHPRGAAEPVREQLF